MTTQIILFVLVGITAGILSGILGLGGGIVIVPALVFLFGMSQHHAQGTTLALMVPPIGLLAAMVYYKQGYVDIKAAAFICAGFFIGGLIGAKAAARIDDVVLSKVFATVMIIVAVKMFFR
jgi:uncharacterized membrane protein YfcA